MKPGIRRLAINRSKELNKKKRYVLNCLLMKQVFFTKELQTRDMFRFGQLMDIKSRIQEWYENESRKVVLQSKLDDVQQSKKVRIYHHKQHRKQIKKTSILKLQTETGTCLGLDACSSDLENQLLHPANLDPIAQATLSLYSLKQTIKTRRSYCLKRR